MWSSCIFPIVLVPVTFPVFLVLLMLVVVLLVLMTGALSQCESLFLPASCPGPARQAMVKKQHRHRHRHRHHHHHRHWHRRRHHHHHHHHHRHRRWRLACGRRLLAQTRHLVDCHLLCLSRFPLHPPPRVVQTRVHFQQSSCFDLAQCWCCLGVQSCGGLLWECGIQKNNNNQILASKRLGATFPFEQQPSTASLTLDLRQRKAKFAFEGFSRKTFVTFPLSACEQAKKLSPTQEARARNPHSLFTFSALLPSPATAPLSKHTTTPLHPQSR